MSKTKTKEELVRLAWQAKLRSEGHRQCVGPFTNGGKKVCAVILLYQMLQPEPTECEGLSTIFFAADYASIGRMAGLDERQTGNIIRMNDGDVDAGRKPMTFSQIADVIDSWFPS